jgi:hypothetical protein
MKKLVLLVILVPALVSCASVKNTKYDQRKRCITEFFNNGMSAQEAVATCKFALRRR